MKRSRSSRWMWRSYVGGRVVGLIEGGRRIESRRRFRMDRKEKGKGEKYGRSTTS
jgi:hypothetical protein